MSDDNNVDIHLRGHVSGVKEAAAETKDTLRDLKQDVVNNAADMAGVSRSLAGVVAGMSAAFVGVTAAAYATWRAYQDGQAEMQAMNLAIAKTGDYAGTTRDELRLLAADMANSSQTSISQSKELATALAATGQIGQEAFRTVSLLATDFGRVMGVEADKVAPKLASLFADPAKGAEELNRTLHFLTATEMENIRALEEMGRGGEAQAELAGLLKGKLDEINETIDHQATLWQKVKNEASGWWDWMGSIGREETTGERIRALEAAMAPGRGLFSDTSEESRAELARLRAKLAEEQGVASRAAERAAQEETNARGLSLADRYSVTGKAGAIDRKISLLREVEPETVEQANRIAEAIAKLNEQRDKLFEEKPGKKEKANPFAGLAGFDDNRSAKEIMAELHAEERAMEALAKARRAMGDSVARLGDTYARDIARAGERDMPAAQRELADSLRRVDEQAASARKEITRYADAQKDQVAAQAAATVSMAELNAKTTEQKDAVTALWEEQQRLNGSWERGATRALDKYKEAAANVAGQTESAFLRAYSSIEDAAVKAAMGQKVSWRDMANSMIADIIRVQARAMVADTASQTNSWLKLAVGAVVSYFGGSGGAGSMSSGGSVQGNSDYVYDLHSGGVVGSGEGSALRARPMSLFSGAPRYHGGGLVDGEVPIIAKKGEGVFTPEQMKAMGGDTIQINVAVDASGEKSSGGGGQMNDLGRRIGAAVRAVIVEEQRPGGLLSAA